MPSNLPARAVEEIDELALIFLFGFSSLGHVVMAMVIILAMIVKAVVVGRGPDYATPTSYMPKIQHVTENSGAPGISNPRPWTSTPILRCCSDYFLLGATGDLEPPAPRGTSTRPSDHPHLAAFSSAAKELIGAIGFEP